MGAAAFFTAIKENTFFLFSVNIYLSNLMSHAGLHNGNIELNGLLEMETESMNEEDGRH